MAFMAQLFAASFDQAQTMLATRGTDYVLLCPDLAEIAFYRSKAPRGMADRLSQGETPDWLQPVATGRENTLKMWRIVPDGN